MTKCNECGDDKERVWTGKTHTNGRKVYIDESLRQWKGMICPDCRLTPTTKQTPRENITRNCRVCAEKLPPTHYFNCGRCLAILEDDTLEYGKNTGDSNEI